MEYQARLTDNFGILDLPIEAETPVKALLKSQRVRFFIQEVHPERLSDILQVVTLAKVIRHDSNFIEHQIIWSLTEGFRKEKDTPS